MRLTILLMFSLVAVAAHAEPNFVANHFVGKTLAEFNKSVRGAVRPDRCAEGNQNKCMEKYKKACECQNVVVTSQQALKRDISTVTIDGKIASYSYGVVNATRLPLNLVYETVESFFGNDAPTDIYSLKPNGPTQEFYLTWKLADGYAWAWAICPMKKVAGKYEVASKIRECFYSRAVIARILQTVKPPDGAVKSNLKY